MSELQVHEHSYSVGSNANKSSLQKRPLSQKLPKLINFKGGLTFFVCLDIEAWHTESV